MQFNPVIVDLSHYDDVQNWDAVQKFGILGVINKATQGTGMVDKTYAIRRPVCAQRGMLWGGYHFATEEDGAAQADHFLEVCQPDASTLMALDWETHDVPLAVAKAFLQRIIDQTRRKAVAYVGGAVRDLVPANDDFLSGHRLWLPQYGPVARVSPPWTNYWLWQFTGDGTGPDPHNVPGITIAGKGIDINHYGGTKDQLAAEWAS